MMIEFPCRVAAFDFSRGFKPTVSVMRINSVASATVEPSGMIQSSLRDAKQAFAQPRV
jgi:hypothetical protein